MTFGSKQFIRRCFSLGPRRDLFWLTPQQPTRTLTNASSLLFVKWALPYHKSVYTIMNALGKTGTPTTKELEFIRRWTNEYGFTNDIILEACDRTVLATDKHRFEYTEGILNSWKRDGVHHKSDITKLDNHYQQKQKQTATKPATANRFNQFTQNTYDFAELEKELLSN